MFGFDVCIDCEEIYANTKATVCHEMFISYVSMSWNGPLEPRGDQSNDIFASNKMSQAFLLLRLYLLSIWKCDQNEINNFVHFHYYQTTTTGKSLFIFKNSVSSISLFLLLWLVWLKFNWRNLAQWEKAQWR